MTYETLTFIRNVIGQFTIKVGEPDFRTTATQLIVALDELDKEIADAGNSGRFDPPDTLKARRASLPDPTELDS